MIKGEEKEKKKNLVEYIGVVNKPIYATRRVMIPWLSQRCERSG
jgi:hypothetical protein